jgi:hypothetical protein
MLEMSTDLFGMPIYRRSCTKEGLNGKLRDRVGHATQGVATRSVLRAVGVVLGSH